MLHLRPLVLSALWVLCLAPPAASSDAAPATGSGARPDTIRPLPAVGGLEVERLRLAQLLGRASSRGFLLRSPSALDGDRSAADGVTHGFRGSLVPPELRAVWNSDLPFSLNEGALWAGRGLSTRLTAGVRLGYGPVTLIAAPHLVHERNRGYQVTSFPETGGDRQRHRLASLFHYPPGSADVPLRFGTEPRTRVHPGRSSLTVRTGAVAFGASTENLWWGPGVRNALLLSDHAPGVPHLFLRTAEPLETGWGAVEARWMVGRLSESDFFDFDPDNDHRSLSALAVVFSPAVARGLSVGAARAVYAPSESAPVDAALDVFRNVGRPYAEAGDTLLEPGPDQVFTVFARWVFPSAGFEVYGEWGRYEQPASVRDFLELPYRSRGYTLGLQHARPVELDFADGDEILRIRAEHTSLEPSPAYRVRRFGEWYASRRVPQGYTHRGRVLGAAVGPSGSGQWAAADVVGEGWEAGVHLGRIRWENQAQFTYRQEFRRADVSLFLGLSGGGEVGPVRFRAQYVPGVRLNYLFQGQFRPSGEMRGVDVRNHTLRLTLSTPSPTP